MTTSPRPEAPGPVRGLPTVGGYTLLSHLGEGGMGIVHLARRSGGDRVALKVLRPHIVGDDEARARLAREVGSLSRIRSRWVAEIVDADPWADVPYVATRYVPGLSLHDHVAEEGAITGLELLWFASCLAEGLASVHSVGVLHRDIKPSNVLMEGRTPILIDFGLARVADDPRLTHVGFLLGTPGYLAPEILYGEDATAASDVHSWGATVAYAGTGRAPFGRGPAVAIMDRVRRGEHDLSGLPEDLHGLVTACLDPDPARRPSLESVRGWLRPRTHRDGPAAPLAAPHEDAFTIPLALAAQAAAYDVTDRIPGAEPYTLALPTEVTPYSLEPARTRLPERLRRGVLLGLLAVATGAGVAAYPWVVATVLVLVVWLLRSGSLAASAAGERRRFRGRRWYDGVQFLVAAPWHLMRSIGGTLVLELWGIGLAVSAALVCYAVAAGVPTTLFVSGIVLAVALWCGPGGSRVRSPLARVVNPVSARTRSWLVGVVALLAVLTLLVMLVESNGVSWTPARDRPLAGPDRETSGQLLAGRGSMRTMQQPEIIA